MPIEFKKLTVGTGGVKICDPSPRLTSLCIFHKEASNTVFIGTRKITTSDLDIMEIYKTTYVNLKWPEERIRDHAFHVVASASSTVYVWLAYAPTEET